MIYKSVVLKKKFHIEVQKKYFSHIIKKSLREIFFPRVTFFFKNAADKFSFEDFNEIQHGDEWLEEFKESIESLYEEEIKAIKEKIFGMKKPPIVHKKKEKLFERVLNCDVKSWNITGESFVFEVEPENGKEDL